jgi:tetratricopeptide (TPR) repeat protein
MIFVDSFPNKARVLLIAPLYLRNGEKRLMIHSPGRIYLEKKSHQRLGLWLVLDNALLSVEKTNDLKHDFPGAEIRNVGGHTMIRWKADKEPLIKNLIEMVKFLIPLRSDKEEEYRLLLAKFHLLDMNIKKSLKELEILENLKYALPGERKDSKRTHPFLQFIGKWNVYNKDYKQIVLNTLYTDIGKQLWIFGNKFLSEERFDEAVSAWDKCTQLSDQYHALVAKRYVSLGNRFLRLGRIGEAVSILDKATKLNPDDYMYHLSLAEAYRENGVMNKSLDEYRKAFNMPFLSDEFLYQIVSKPRLFAIWKENKTWHFMWRSDKKCTFSGKIYFNRGIAKLRRYRFGRRDTVHRYENHGLEFVIRSDKRVIKSLDVDVGKKSQLTCYVEIDNQITTDDIVFINSSKNPEKVPFYLSSGETKHKDKKDSNVVN